MRQLHPTPSTLELTELPALYAADDRPPPADRPWVLLDMIASTDGATAVEGRSGGLGGGEPDKASFHALRAVADVVLAGAGTVRAERYGPPKVPEAERAARVARGQAPQPRMAVVSASLDLHPGLGLFSEAVEGNRPYVISRGAADPTRREALQLHCDDVIAVGDEQVDLAAGLAELRRRGVGLVVCEGGPTLNGALLAADLVDEMCLSIAPTMVGGGSARIAHGPPPPEVVGMRLARVLEQDGVLLARWVRG